MMNDAYEDMNKDKGDLDIAAVGVAAAIVFTRDQRRPLSSAESPGPGDLCAS